MKKVFFFVLFILLLVVIPTISAQTSGSVGCQQWRGGVGGGLIGSTSGNAVIPISIPSADYIAGEELRFSWSVSEAHTMTVTSSIVNDVVSNPASFSDTYTINVPANGSYGFTFTLEFAYTGGYFYVYTLACVPPSIVTSTMTQQADFNPIICSFDDGRINNRDCDSSVVIYETDTDIDIYAVEPVTSVGTLILRVPLTAVNADNELTLLGSVDDANTGVTVQLWQLASGELQMQTTLVDAKPYIIIWSLDAEGYDRIDG